MPVTLRIPVIADAQPIQRIYASYVTDTVISFEEIPPTVPEMENRLRQSLPIYPWVVAEMDQTLVGYAYAGQHRRRAAYRWTVETSIYLDSNYLGKGIGHQLYRALLQILKSQGFLSVYAGIALPNPPSIGLHERVGFKYLGVFSQVGFKFNRWVDVGWWELKLEDPTSLKLPLATKPFTEIPDLDEILKDQFSQQFSGNG